MAFELSKKLGCVSAYLKTQRSQDRDILTPSLYYRLVLTLPSEGCHMNYALHIVLRHGSRHYFLKRFSYLRDNQKFSELSGNRLMMVREFSLEHWPWSWDNLF